MEVCMKGIGVSAGYAVGELYVLTTEEESVPRSVLPAAAVREELERMGAAYRELVAFYEQSIQKTPPGVRREAEDIFRGHMALGADVLSRVQDQIREGRFGAEYALWRVLRPYLKHFQSEGESGQGFLSAVQDVRRNYLRILLGKRTESLAPLKNPAILVAPDLTPSQTVHLDLQKVLGFMTDVGGPTSHTAILAREMGLPAVVGLETVTQDVSTGDSGVLDGQSGQVVLHPSAETVKKYGALERNYREYRRRLIVELRDLAPRTMDGCECTLLANIEFPEEIPAALGYGASGVGLFRTEFLLLESGEMLSEEQQAEAYRRAIAALGSREISIRTLDIGGDKILQDGAQRERNPFLGCRAVRLYFHEEQMFRSQLRAIYRASVEGSSRILIPMISSIDELRRIRTFAQDVRQELGRQGIAFRADVPLGIMIETPSAALTVDLFAKEVDFFSIGTNDLVQYSLAVDRTNERVASLYQPTHPAILRLIRLVIEAGERNGRDVSLCGEMAGDPRYVPLLVGLGLRRFSVAPASIPEVKGAIRSVSLRKAREIAQRALSMDSSEKINAFLDESARRLHGKQPH